MYSNIILEVRIVLKYYDQQKHCIINKDRKKRFRGWIQLRWYFFIYSRFGIIISMSGEESISSQSNMFCFGIISERGSYLSNLVVS